MSSLIAEIYEIIRWVINMHIYCMLINTEDSPFKRVKHFSWILQTNPIQIKLTCEFPWQVWNETWTAKRNETRHWTGFWRKLKERLLYWANIDPGCRANQLCCVFSNNHLDDIDSFFQTQFQRLWKMRRCYMRSAMKWSLHVN